MSFNTALLDFSVDPQVVADPVDSQTLHQRLEEVVRAAVPGFTRRVEDLTPSGGFLLNYSADQETCVTLRGHRSGLVSLQIENFGDAFIMDNRAVLALERDVRAKIGARRSKAILPLRRGLDTDRFYTTSDERLLEYDMRENLFDQVTPYQRVQLLRTRDFGVVLTLDGYHNLSEKDGVYTSTLMGAEQYTDKTALILGGGDGGLLRELLKHNPSFVTMVEIDDVVMQQCRLHMRSVCGDCLDQYQADNYKIIVGDAFSYLKDSVAAGRQFDYVFYDLSDVPVSPEHDRDVWRMVSDVVSDSMKLLPPGGKYMTHVTGVNCPAALSEFEKMVDDLPTKTTRVQTAAFVPSFLETWVFYWITKC